MKLNGQGETREATDCPECGHTLLRGTHADNAGGPGDKGCDLLVTRNGVLVRCGCKVSP